MVARGRRGLKWCRGCTARSHIRIKSRSVHVPLTKLGQSHQGRTWIWFQQVSYPQLRDDRLKSESDFDWTLILHQEMLDALVHFQNLRFRL